MGFRGNEEKFKDYLEDICELLRDQLQINILRRQHCDDMAGNGSSDSESTDSSDASDDTEDEDKGDKDASTPKRDGHGYGYPSGECSRSAVPTTALVPDVREIWEKMDAEALKKLLANKEEEMFKVAEESKRIKSIITKQESQKKKELKKQKDKEKREEKAKETQDKNQAFLQPELALQRDCRGGSGFGKEHSQGHQGGFRIQGRHQQSQGNSDGLLPRRRSLERSPPPSGCRRVEASRR